MTAMTWKPLDASRANWVYVGSANEDRERGCIGHLRGDFGHDGDEFWTSWFPRTTGRVTDAFFDEFQAVVKALRKRGAMLENYRTMCRLCRGGLKVEEDRYAFEAETQHRFYCLRCNTLRGDYQFYLYAYDKDAMSEEV